MLKLMLVDDDRILLELPLSAQGWDRSELRSEIEGLEQDAERLSNLFDALSNTGRMRMMSVLFEESDHPMAFTQLMNELGMNPKLVSDSTKRLRMVGLIEKNEEGRYRPTREGEANFTMISVALRRLLKILGEI